MLNIKSFHENGLALRPLCRDFKSFPDSEEKDEEIGSESSDLENENVVEVENCNGTKEILGTFDQECVVRLKLSNVNGFRQFGHQCFCEICYTSSRKKRRECFVCKLKGVTFWFINGSKI